MARRHILVVEDDEGLREGLGLVLEGAGFSVTAVGDAATALDHLRQGVGGLVFLDLGLKGMTGRALVSACAEEGLDAAFVLVSGEEDLPTAAERLGAVGHLRKPFDVSAMITLAQRLCPVDTAAKTGRPG